MTSKQFEAECEQRITGWLWDSSFNEEYQEHVTLSVAEMRELANMLRAAEGRTLQSPREFDEADATATATK